MKGIESKLADDAVDYDASDLFVFDTAPQRVDGRLLVPGEAANIATAIHKSGRKAIVLYIEGGIGGFFMELTPLGARVFAEQLLATADWAEGKGPN